MMWAALASELPLICAEQERPTEQQSLNIPAACQSIHLQPERERERPESVSCGPAELGFSVLLLFLIICWAVRLRSDQQTVTEESRVRGYSRRTCSCVLSAPHFNC